MSEEFLFDTHVHLDRPVLHDRLTQVLTEAKDCGVTRFLIPGVCQKHWDRLLTVTAATPGALAAPGVHPLAADQWDAQCEQELATLLKHPEVVALGEIGLDGLLDTPHVQSQEHAFRGQLRLAKQANLPVLIHCRKASGRLLDILREEDAAAVGGILHAFSGSVEIAQQAIKLGFGIGFGGVLTYPNARRAPEVLKAIPAEWIVLETDAPDLAPHPHRSENNRPAWLALIAREAARLRGWSLEQTARVTTENACRILKL